MEQFRVTKDIIRQARDYVPIGEKEAFSKKASSLCVDALTMKDDDFPPYYHANIGRMNRALMAALVGLYLNQEIEVEVDENKEGWLVSEAEYDRLAGSHIIGQLQRMKSDMLVRDKVFDMLSDYGELERMLKSEIEALIAPRNDTTVRMTLCQKGAVEQLPKIKEAIELFMEQKKEQEAKEG